MSKPDANISESVIQAVDEQERNTADLRRRFDEDLDLYRLSEFDGITSDMTLEQRLNEKGYRHFTSNEPRTFADKLIYWEVNADLRIHIPSELSSIEGARFNDSKERFAFGVLRTADERLRNQMQPPLIEQIAFYATVRGFVFARTLLNKGPDGETVVIITPWDPRNVYWETADDGLVWACHKVRKSRARVMAEYGVDVSGDASGEVVVYDFYDRQVNTVIAGGVVLKSPVPHAGSPLDRVPVSFSVAGPSPMISTFGSAGDMAYFGESVFAANRRVYGQNNFMLSVLLELAARQRKPGIKIFSRDGSLSLDGDPHKSGAEISLMKDQEDVQVLEQPQTNTDFSQLISLINQEREKGSIPSVNFGNLPFALSGFAIKNLQDNAVGALSAPLNAIRDFLHQAINMITDQYSTGAFPPLEISGRLPGKRYFREAFLPEDIALGGEFVVELEPNLPADDQTNFAMAQMARGGRVPLLSDTWILENLLSVQDVGSERDRINEQIAERSAPMAQLITLYQSALNRGRFDLAKVLLAELRLMMATQLRDLESGTPGAAPASRREGHDTSGFPPEILPTPQAPGMTAFTSRIVNQHDSNSARHHSNALNALGLFGPND